MVPTAPVLTVRAISGLSGDMMLVGLLRMLDGSQEVLDSLTASLGLPAISGSVRLMQRDVRDIRGWACEVNLPQEHAHRRLADITAVIASSAMAEQAKVLAVKTFSLLARAEGAVHGKDPEDVCFHEVGALDSILDICLCCALFTLLAPVRFVCSALPLADGGVYCAHGWLPTPAPAVLALLEGIPVRAFPSSGETVTPTAIALLKSLDAEFGPWPSMRVERQALVYGGKIFPDAPNGSIWAYGQSFVESSGRERGVYGP